MDIRDKRIHSSNSKCDSLLVSIAIIIRWLNKSIVRVKVLKKDTADIPVFIDRTITNLCGLDGGHYYYQIHSKFCWLNDGCDYYILSLPNQSPLLIITSIHQQINQLKRQSTETVLMLTFQQQYVYIRCIDWTPHASMSDNDNVPPR